MLLTIIKIILIYILFGEIIYLLGQYYSDKELTHFQQEFFYTLCIIFLPIIKAMLFLDTIVYIIKATKMTEDFSDEEKQDLYDITNNSDKSEKDEK